MKKIFALVVIFGLTFLLTKCSEDKIKEGPIPLSIEIDSSKIGTLFQDSLLAVSFYPPFLWEIYNTELSDRVETVREVNKSLTKKYRYSPKYLFFKYGANSLLSVGEITLIDTSESPENFLDNYVKHTTSKYSPENLTIAEYIKDGLFLKHVKSEVKNLVSYKYILKNQFGNLVQFDYTFRSRNLEEELPSVLSSLGTVQLKP